jgi:Winged helix DNA-binding domain
MLSPTILARGRIVGTWRRTLCRGGVVIEPRPFTPLGRAEQRALAAASERYAGFLGLPIVETRSRAVPARPERPARADA